MAAIATLILGKPVLPIFTGKGNFQPVAEGKQRLHGR
jgi:hypothetical protein